MALKKKAANRMQIGSGKMNTSSGPSEKEKKAKAREEASFEFTKKQIGSDYYATHEEDPLLAS